MPGGSDTDGLLMDERSLKVFENRNEITLLTLVLFSMPRERRITLSLRRLVRFFHKF